MTVKLDRYEFNHVAAVIGEENLISLLDEYAFLTHRLEWVDAIKCINKDIQELHIYDDAGMDYANLVKAVWKAIKPEDFYYEYSTPWCDEDEKEEMMAAADIAEDLLELVITH